MGRKHEVNNLDLWLSFLVHNQRAFEDGCRVYLFIKSDVPKVKYFIPFPSDPFILFTRVAAKGVIHKPCGQIFGHF